jgi:molecular chaperone HscB
MIYFSNSLSYKSFSQETLDFKNNYYNSIAKSSNFDDDFVTWERDLYKVGLFKEKKETYTAFSFVKNIIEAPAEFDVKKYPENFKNFAAYVKSKITDENKEKIIQAMNNYVEDRNYFELLGLPTQFEIDLTLLDQHYRKLQSEVHPDRFVTASANDRMQSMQVATQANEAYQTLKNTTARARYLLQLNGIETLEESNTAMPADFLMLQMEWREAIDDANGAKNVSALDALLLEIKQMAKSLSQNLNGQFAEKAYVKASESVRKLSFIDKISADINRAIEQLEN